jgi:hypothetical protein
LKKIQVGKIVSLAMVVVIAVGGAMFLRRHDPVEASWYPLCIFHQLTSLHCPGCGATRALHALLNGRFVEAVCWNPFLVLGGPLIAGVLWWRARQERRGLSTPAYLPWVLFVVVVTYAILRNVPTPEQSWLAPRSPDSVSEFNR